MSTSRWLSTERRNRYRGKRGPGGKFLCRWCGNEVTDKRRRTWCGDGCVHEYLLRTSGSYLRRQVKLRDNGVCIQCQCDCYKLRRVIRAYAKLAGRDDARALLTELGFGNVYDLERSYWEAEHVVPVCEGGGEMGLEGIVTLCRACHLVETKALAKRRAELRRAQRTDPHGSPDAPKQKDQDDQENQENQEDRPA